MSKHDYRPIPRRAGLPMPPQANTTDTPSTSPTPCSHCRNGWFPGTEIECVNGVLIDIDVAHEGWQRDVDYPAAPCVSKSGKWPKRDRGCQARLEEWAATGNGDADLRPCPFCGSEAVYGQVGGDGGDAGGQFVQCSDPTCGASSALIFPCGDEPKPLLLERWNRRVQHAT